MMHRCLQEVNSSGGIKGKTEAKLLSGLVVCGLKFWYINNNNSRIYIAQN